MRVIDALAQTSLRSLRSPCQRGVNVVLIEKLFLHLLEWIHVGTLKEDPIPNVPFILGNMIKC